MNDEASACAEGLRLVVGSTRSQADCASPLYRDRFSSLGDNLTIQIPLFELPSLRVAVVDVCAAVCEPPERASKKSISATDEHR